MNLPAHLVVVKSTQAWRGAGKGYQEYSKATLLQMVGRAGRPQFDTEGVAVIMTHSSRVQQWRGISSGMEQVESTLGESLIEHMVAELCLGTISSMQEALQWLRSTFYYRRLCANPQHYGLHAGAAASNSSSSSGGSGPSSTSSSSSSSSRSSSSSTVTRLSLQDRVDMHVGHVLAVKLFQLCQAGCIEVLRLRDRLSSSITLAGGLGGGGADHSDAVGETSSSSSSSSSSSTAAVLALSAFQQPLSLSSVDPSDLHPFSINNVLELKASSSRLYFRALSSAHIISRNYLRFETFLLFRSLGREAGVVELLQHFCQAKEIVGSITLRREEKKVRRWEREGGDGRERGGGGEGEWPLLALAPSTAVCLSLITCSFPFLLPLPLPLPSAPLQVLREIKEKLGRVRSKRGTEGKVATLPDKAFQLLQMALGRLKLEASLAAGPLAYSLRMEAFSILELLKRIVKAFSQYCAAAEVRSPLLAVSHTVERMLAQQLWHDEPILRQMLQFVSVMCHWGARGDQRERGPGEEEGEREGGSLLCNAVILSDTISANTASPLTLAPVSLSHLCPLHSCSLE